MFSTDYSRCWWIWRPIWLLGWFWKAYRRPIFCPSRPHGRLLLPYSSLFCPLADFRRHQSVSHKTEVGPYGFYLPSQFLTQSEHFTADCRWSESIEASRTFWPKPVDLDNAAVRAPFCLKLVCSHTITKSKLPARLILDNNCQLQSRSKRGCRYKNMLGNRANSRNGSKNLCIQRHLTNRTTGHVNPYLRCFVGYSHVLPPARHIQREASIHETVTDQELEKRRPVVVDKKMQTNDKDCSYRKKY